MAENIYILNGDKSITVLEDTPYENEGVFQSLIESHPEILAGDQMKSDDGNPRKFILISREMGISDREGGGDRWSIDHLFVDQDAKPVFVEVKRSTDTRIRREVVGQMLEYAANGSQNWPLEKIIQRFRESHGSLDDFELSEDDDNSFWGRFEDNLHSGKFTLLFVADEIPMELQRIIEFLNEQMKNTEVIALEIKQFVSKDKVTTLVPHIIGQTLKALDVKNRNTKQWNEESFIEAIKECGTEGSVEICQKLLDEFKNAGCNIYWGKGVQNCGFIPYINEKNGNMLSLFKVAVNCNLILYFDYYKKRSPFNLQERRQELQSKFNKIEGIVIPADKLEKRPNFSLSVLYNDKSYNAFVAIIKDMIDDFKKENTK